MTSRTEPTTAASPLASAQARFPWLSWACLLLAGGIVLFPLTYTWSHQANYAFGWWVAPLAAFLFWERWDTRPAPDPTVPAPGVRGILVGWGLLYFFCRMMLETSLGSGLLLLSCAALYVGALLYWMRVYGGLAWTRHFAFPICFLLIAVPWPGFIEEPLVQGLAWFNAWLVAHVLVLCGVYAQAMGKVIVLANCTLGVEEACSGIRSLQAALMIGLLAGEIYRFAWPRRLRVIALALGLALLGNFLRAFGLSLLAAARGVEVMNQWHDSAGVSILIFTSVMTWLACVFLNGRDSRLEPSASKVSKQLWPFEQSAVAQRFAWGILLATVVGSLATEGWYRWREPQYISLPTWTAQFPATAKELPIAEQTRDLLRYDSGHQVEWQDEQGWDWVGYWFRYLPKPLGASIFQEHNPDKCLPSTGLVKVADNAPFDVEIHGIKLQVNAEQFSWQNAPVYVFWVVYANRSSFSIENAVRKEPPSFVTKPARFLSDVWHGRRVTPCTLESFETIITGPESYDAARAGYLAALPAIIVPDAK